MRKEMQLFLIIYLAIDIDSLPARATGPLRAIVPGAPSGGGGWGRTGQCYVTYRGLRRGGEGCVCGGGGGGTVVDRLYKILIFSPSL